MFLSLNFIFVSHLLTKTLASLRYTDSGLLSPRSDRLMNRNIISAIKRFGICVHNSRKRTQHAINVIDAGIRISCCSHTRMDRRNLIFVHSISSSIKTNSGLRVGCFNALSVQRNHEKNPEISTFYMRPTHGHSLHNGNLTETTWR